MIFKLRTLTPLWMGIGRMKPDAHKASAIIGSLRFWYEGALRGRGVEVCSDAGSDCPGCACCELFGSTSRARAFRLFVHGLEPKSVAEASGNARSKFKPSGTMPRTALWSDHGFELEVIARTGQIDAVARFAFALHYALTSGESPRKPNMDSGR